MSVRQNSSVEARNGHPLECGAPADREGPRTCPPVSPPGSTEEDGVRAKDDASLPGAGRHRPLPGGLLAGTELPAMLAVPVLAALAALLVLRLAVALGFALGFLVAGFGAGAAIVAALLGIGQAG